MIFPATYAVTATATSLTDILGLSAIEAAKQITIKNADAATAAIYLSKDGTNFAELSAGQGLTMTGNMHTGMVSIAGTVNAANVAYILVIN